VQDINAQSSLIIRTLEPQDIPVIVKAFQGIGWRSKTTKLYLSYWNEQNSRKRTIFVALLGGVFTGYVTVKWQSDYPPFIERNIPEIADLNVLPKYRRRGIATLLVEEAERRIFEISNSVGIGFGITADYGPAQRMYVGRGYIPDGQGLFADGRYIHEGAIVNIDDCVIYLTKEKTKYR
jgi:GNAT superfamily N-acetyltransferase